MLNLCDLQNLAWKEVSIQRTCIQFAFSQCCTCYLHCLARVIAIGYSCCASGLFTCNLSLSWSSPSNNWVGGCWHFCAWTMSFVLKKLGRLLKEVRVHVYYDHLILLLSNVLRLLVPFWATKSVVKMILIELLHARQQHTMHKAVDGFSYAMKLENRDVLCHSREANTITLSTEQEVADNNLRENEHMSFLRCNCF